MANYYVSKTLYAGVGPNWSATDQAWPGAIMSWWTAGEYPSWPCENYGILMTGGLHAGKSVKITSVTYDNGHWQLNFTDPGWTPAFPDRFEIIEGADDNDGTQNVGAGSTGPFGSIDRAMNAVAAGDTVHVRAGTYVGIATIDTVGTIGNPISFIGYKDTPGDAAANIGNADYRAKLNANANITGGIVVNAAISATASLYYVFENIEVFGSAGDGFALTTRRHIRLYNCASYSNDNGNGISCGIRCGIFVSDFYGNTSYGVNATVGVYSIVGCRIYNNAGAYQVYSGSFVNALIGNIVYGLPTNGCGVGYTDGNADSFLCGNIVDGEGIAGTIGYRNLGNGILRLINNIAHRVATGYQGAFNNGYYGLMYNNCVNVNAGGTKYINCTNLNAVESDPLFVDQANYDYRFMPTSPCLETGFPANIGSMTNKCDIGALQRRPGKRIPIIQGCNL